MTSETFAVLTDILKEYGIDPDGLNGEEAAIKLINTLGETLTNEDFELQSGDYGLMATGFGLVTAEHFKLVKDFMFKCKLRSLMIGFEYKARIKPNIKYHKKPYAAVSEPSQILWEFSGVTYESAMQICQQVSEMIGQELRIIYKNIYG